MIIKGIVKDGVIKPVEDIKLLNNQEVAINMPDEKTANNIIADEKQEEKRLKELIMEKGCHINLCILCETLNFIQNQKSPYFSFQAYEIINKKKEYLLSFAS